MIVQMPGAEVYPTQPHSFIVNLNLGNTSGGLVDGPVYSAIFSGLKGVNMEGGINYLDVQPGTMVYHDSTHDYSTNEPTMDGTASLTFPFSAYQMEGAALKGVRKDKNGVVSRVNVNEKKVYLVFTAHYSSDDKGHFENFDGVVPVLNTLKAKGVKGSFFPTGECFRQPRYKARSRESSGKGITFQAIQTSICFCVREGSVLCPLIPLSGTSAVWRRSLSVSDSTKTGSAG